MERPDAPADEPVTTLFTWKVVPGREHEFEDWLRGINAAAARFPGHQGVTWLRPSGEGRHYHAVLRFSSADQLTDWLRSDERAAWTRRVEGIAAEAADRAHTTGLETWFSLPHTAVRPPPRWKMSLVSFCAVYPCVLLFNVLFAAELAPWPVALRALVLPMVMAPLLTYAIMPLLSQLLRRWLYPNLG
ncbi:antibiotic biosynthesis monooxygenase [Nocardiopsis gilva YIM 90087]|uniref:Antibiotic biosynthesis monooxygenase n=1 Tax=Nocardiopsis gilva YIM 90087 TaxID=1235441 RepID=A0A223S4X5_9ACTN|nr:antibiotic biosynthesis monooxygenase [Nocardiopsis gilva]ASU83127.1 antibiotic biosynthesis monooxygenase [Nocardiopsis gilva YIM 90087]